MSDYDEDEFDEEELDDEEVENELEEDDEDFVPDYGYENAEDNWDAAHDDVIKQMESGD